MGEGTWRKKIIQEPMRLVDIDRAAARRMFREEVRKYAKLHRRYHPIWKVEEAVQGIRIRKRREHRPILVYFASYLADVVLAARARMPVVLLVRGYQDRLFALRHHIPYVSLGRIYPYLEKYIEQETETNAMELRRRIAQVLEEVNPRALISFNDQRPLERAFIWEARERNIPTIDIQHGLLAEKYVRRTDADGWFADYMLVWGDRTRRNYIQAGRAPRQVKVLGYPYRVHAHHLPHKPHVIYYLDQGDLFKSEVAERRSRKMLEMEAICRKLGLRFICRLYRPDHFDPMRRKHPHIEFERFEEPLSRAIAKGHVFVSFNSTALLQAGISGRWTVQITDIYPVEAENYERLGICDKTLKRTTDLEEYLKELLQSREKMKKPIDPHYLYIPPDLGQRMVEILHEIRLEKEKRKR